MRRHVKQQDNYDKYRKEKLRYIIYTVEKCFKVRNYYIQKQTGTNLWIFKNKLTTSIAMADDRVNFQVTEYTRSGISIDRMTV